MSRRLLGACLAAVMAAGCYAKEMVLIDPRVDLQTLIGRKVLIVPVHHQIPVPSDVPALTTVALAEHLGKVSGLEVLTVPGSDAASVAQAEPKPAAIASLAEDHKVDVVVTATIAEFWERQLRDFAQRHSVFALDALAPNSTWRDRPRAEVVMRVTVRFFAGSTGKLLWSREALGGDSEEAPVTETGNVSARLHRNVSQQIGSQIIGDLYPYFSYQDVKPAKP
jgi:hypothetical protein